MLSHWNLIATARSAIAHEGLRETEEVLAYLPMAWVGDHMFSFGQSIVAGFTTNCPESARTVLQDLREIGPTYFFAPPRIWENILTAVMIRVDDASAIKRRMVHFFLDVARRVERNRLARRPVPAARPPARSPRARARVRAAPGQPRPGPHPHRLHRGRGHRPRALRVLSRARRQREAALRHDGVERPDLHPAGRRRQARHRGPPLPGVEVRIGPTGEVLYRSPGVFQGYYKSPEATAEMVEDGWVHSGDAGVFDRDGHLRIIDRARDVGRLADGTLFAPKYLENKLKFSPFVKEAVCVGAGRPFVAALVNIDLAAAGSWAERRNMAYTSYADLAQKPEVYELIRQEVARVNRSLLEDEALRGAQIRKFLLLHKELDPDDQEITRTRKVRRGFIAEKYAALIEALYSDADHVKVEALVTYEDGRTGTVRADVKIRHAEVFAAAGGPVIAVGPPRPDPPPGRARSSSSRT